MAAGGQQRAYTPDVESPFIVHRHELDTYNEAVSRGLSDQAYIDLVTEADARIAGLSAGSPGFTTTPTTLLQVPSGRSVVAKIETASVGGSHKARHLFGLLLAMLIDEQLEPTSAGQPDLAIASCGNAAVGAATVAKANDRRLLVFVPDDADPAVLLRLAELDADVHACPRTPGVAGDPCMAGLEQAVAEGAEPFTVQGPTCPGVIDGGRTLGLELGSQLDDLKLTARDIYIQIGGGALATATMDGLDRHRRRTSNPRPLPRLHPVQPAAAHPYLAGWRRLEARLNEGLTFDAAASTEGIMEPWPGTPTSVATGILDDITYDWLTVARHQHETNGWTVEVDESTFIEATELAAAQIDPPPDATGAAGLAGLLTDDKNGRLDHESEFKDSETTVVLITGVDRSR